MLAIEEYIIKGALGPLAGADPWACGRRTVPVSVTASLITEKVA